MARACASTPARRAAGTLPAALPRHLLAPLDPARFAPSAAGRCAPRPALLDPDTEIRPHQPRLGAGGDRRLRRAPHRRAEHGHLPGARLACGVGPAGHRTCADAWSKPPNCARCTSTSRRVQPAPAWRRPTPGGLAPLPGAGGLAPAARTGAADGRAPGRQPGAGHRGPGARAPARRTGAATNCAARAPVPLGIALPRDKRLRALCEAVIDDPTRHASLAGWAAEAGASARTVARLFRQELATSFGPWRQQVLLAQGADAGRAGPADGAHRRRTRLRQRQRLQRDGATLGRPAADAGCSPRR